MATHAAGLAGRVEFARDAVGLGIEAVMVGRLVDANAPEDDGRMVPVAGDHAAYIGDRFLLPYFTAEMLPARDFLEDEQADFVALVEEVSRLRVMRSAHKIAFE